MYALGRFLTEIILRSDKGLLRIYFGPKRGWGAGRHHVMPMPSAWHVTVQLRGREFTAVDVVLAQAMEIAVKHLVGG